MQFNGQILMSHPQDKSHCSSSLVLFFTIAQFKFFFTIAMMV